MNNDDITFQDVIERRSSSHSEEEGELPAVESDPEELGLKALLLHDVIVVRRLHLLHTGRHTHRQRDTEEEVIPTGVSSPV